MKKTFFLLTLALSLFFAGGCGQEKNSKHQPPENTVKGFEITLPKPPEKIISLTLATDEILVSMVEPQRIRALSCKYADVDSICNVSEAAKNFEKAEDNIEHIVAMNPDLVFTASWMSDEKIQQLRDAGVPVYCYKMPSNIQDERELLAEIAALVGEEEKGVLMAAEMDRVLANVAEKISSVREEDRFTVLMYDPHGGIAMFSDIAEKAGVVNIFDRAGVTSWGNLSKEKIVELNPDIFIVPHWGSRDTEKYIGEILSDPGFSTVNAVRNKRIYSLPSKHINCLSQYVVYGVDDLAKAAYPEMFKNKQLRK
ncbi:ABC transporter substrate-binding protein [uncultured Ilyobacter sp.]|uniref:ABC transporter substrate-binding protein n=1 Tax=uncultured Ilyobacter sp. TaxID=544433 RepID=UPI0029C8145E|nr:ABC transporter substrate-binding protein [uncultured Ilyobacter sp.]